MTSASSGQSWDVELASAFEILLGRPLDGFDPKARYELYHEDDMLSGYFSGADGIFEDYAVLGTVVPPDSDATKEYRLHWNRWGLDLGKSYFTIELSDLTPAIETALGAVAVREAESTFHGTGADLAPILTQLDTELDDMFGTAHVRVVTDGTLFDAMRAATWTMDPDELLEFGSMEGDYDVEVEPEWEEKLAGIANDALRDHLRMLCLTAESARCEGGFYTEQGVGPGIFSRLAELSSYSFVTRWDFGEGQATTGIFQVAG